MFGVTVDMDWGPMVTLNKYLKTNSYIGGHSPTQEDISVLHRIPLYLPLGLPHVKRWNRHMLSFTGQELLKFPTPEDSDLKFQMENFRRSRPITFDHYPNVGNNRQPTPFDDANWEKTEPPRPIMIEIKKMVNPTKLILKTAKGTRDFDPKEMFIRRDVLNTFVDVFQNYGAVEIDTPVFELKDVLTGKYGEDSKLIYDLKDQGGEILALRYDLTVPFARYVAMNKISTIKRYHIAKVYRRDNPAMTKGRYREFYQCDFDIAGQYDAMVPDAECIQLIHQLMTRLDLGNFIIKVNHRKILDGLFAKCGVPPCKFRQICSAVDKLDKMSWAEVREEMVEEKGLDASIADLIGMYVTLRGQDDLIDDVQNDKKLMEYKDARAGVEQIKLLFEYCKSLGCDSNLYFYMGLARGLDYYTGLIFEAVLAEDSVYGHDDVEDYSVGSVAGGGRYDELVGMFDAKGRSVPCVGVSFGIERIFAFTEWKRKSKKVRSSHTQVLVASPGKGMIKERLSLLALLRNENIRAETSYKNNAKFLSQLQYAEENRIPLVLLIGENEVAESIVKLRPTETREEKTVPRTAIIQEVKRLLASLSCS